MTREKLRVIFREYEAGLKHVIGDALDRVLLYGSQARGDAREGSDIDVLCILRAPFDDATLMRETAELTADLSLKHDVVLSRVFVLRQDFETRRLPFYMNVRREAVAV